MLRIGPSGNSDSFYEQGYKHTYQAPKWLFDLGLNAFEYSFGRGISITPPTAIKIGEEMAKYDIQISAHAPYYTNFASLEQENIIKSFNYVANTISAVKLMGGKRIVVHPGSIGKQTREEALKTAQRNIDGLMEFLDEKKVEDYLICIETLGKVWQFGTVEEVLKVIKPYKNLNACLDFGHINSYTFGSLKTKDDFKKIIDLTFCEIGEERAKNIHIHFSKIMYNNLGEIKHLTFSDSEYGPEYAPLAEVIDEYKMTPTVICESKNTMAEDALFMKNCHKHIQSID